MALLYSSEFTCRVHKVRSFDMDIRVRPVVEVLYDCEWVCVLPTTVMYDNIVYCVRNVDVLIDPFASTKDDAASFFSINEMKENQIESTYISSNLKVITPLSETLNRPIGRFDSTKSISSIDLSASGTDTYVALNFEDVEDFNNLEIVRDGIATVMFGLQQKVYTPTSTFEFAGLVNTDDIKHYGIGSEFKLLQNFESSGYITIYSFILKVPNSATTYYFSMTASTVGVMLIDGSSFISQFSSDSVTPVTNDITLSEGYHTVLIKHYAGSSSINDIFRLQVKRAPGDSYVDFNLSTLNSWNVKVFSFPISRTEIQEQGSFYADTPGQLIDPSLNSLLMKDYRPIIVLARKYSSLLQKEFNRIYYKRIPDNVVTSDVLSGTISSLYDGRDFPEASTSIVLNTAKYQVDSPFITYEYQTPVKISMIEYRDVKGADGALVGRQSKSFTISIVDALKIRLRATDLRALIDINASENIEVLALVNNSDTYLSVVKKNTQDRVRIVFTDFISVREITWRDPVVASISLGYITTFTPYLKATEIVKLIDDKGEQSIINTTEDTRLVEVDYDYVGYVPSIFNHKNIAPDVQYGAEFIMFCLDVLGEIDDVETLGNAYLCRNYDNHTVYDYPVLLNYRQLSQLDDRKFALYNDIKKTTSYDFSFISFDVANNQLIEGTASSVTLTFTNEDTVDITNKAFDFHLPSIGTTYSCVDGAMNVVPVAGVTSLGVLTSNLSDWDTNIVRANITSLLSGQSITLTFSSGSFSNTATIYEKIAGKKPTGTYTTAHPVEHTAAYVKATSSYPNNQPYWGTNPTVSLINAMVPDCGWQSGGETGNMKYNISHGRPVCVTRIYIENSHVSGGYTTRGVRYMTVYGTNSATAFANTTYADLTDLTVISGGTLEIAQHVASNVPDPKYYTIPNTQYFLYTVIRIASSWGDSYVGFRRIAMQETDYMAQQLKYSITYPSVQMPLIATKVPSIPANKTATIFAHTSETFPIPSSGIFQTQSGLVLAKLLVTETTGVTRTNVEITVDVSDIVYTYRCPLRVYEASTNLALDTVGVNNDNSVTDNFGGWEGYRIVFRAPILQGGISTLFYIKISSFSGTPSSFIPSVQTNMRHRIHFSGNLVDSVTGTVGYDGGVLYNSDKLRSYQKALQIVTSNSYARFELTTATTNFSISFWFMATVSGGLFCLANQNTLPATTRDMRFNITTAGYLQCQVLSGAGSTMVVTNKRYDDGQWHNVLLTMHSVDGMKLYVDSVQVASNSITARTITTAYAYVGWSDGYGLCSFDELRVYDKCLSSVDAVTLYALFDGTVSGTDQQYVRTDVVLSPASRITTLSDLAALQGTPRIIYKYISIDETLIREIGE